MPSDNPIDQTQAQPRPPLPLRREEWVKHTIYDLGLKTRTSVPDSHLDPAHPLTHKNDQPPPVFHRLNAVDDHIRNGFPQLGRTPLHWKLTSLSTEHADTEVSTRTPALLPTALCERNGITHYSAHINNGSLSVLSDTRKVLNATHNLSRIASGPLDHPEFGAHILIQALRL
jgi:hypothetical protein